MANRLITLFGLFISAHFVNAGADRYGSRTCQEITVPMCKGIGYNMTYMPNQFNHDSQEEAGLEVHQFWPLVEIKCSPDLQFFLCSMYTPICMTNYDKPLPACRSICERAKAGCAPLMRQYGFPWPDRINCEQLPEFGDENQLCMDFNTSSSTTTVPPIPPLKPASPVRPKVTEKPIVTAPASPNAYKDVGDPGSPDIQIQTCECSCRYPLLPVSESSVYYNSVFTGGIANCAISCSESYFSPEAINFATFWVGAWSILCCVSTFLTVVTYLIDMDRFMYPEKPIIFLSACYFMVSVGYIIRLIAGREMIGCDGEMVRYESTAPALCTIVFLLIYFFGMSACIWWVILSFTWFLAAGMKWGQEAISSYSQYFHLVAWVIPSIKTITILAMSAIDGDSVSGICYVGNQSLTNLWAFVLAPTFAYLVLGLTFLFAGFINLFRIRDTMKQQGKTKVEKLEKLMIKIGVFSVLYTVPATIVIACHLYEQHFRREWDISIACPCSEQASKPDYSVFMLKYFMCHIIGITSGFWIWSSKTLTAWRSFCSRITCRHQYDRRDKYLTVNYRRAPPVPTPSTKSLCPSSV